VLRNLLRQVEASGRPCLAISPHLDDAGLSVGAWLASLAEICPVVVATVFSAAAPEPHSWIADWVVRKNGYQDAAELYQERRKEDSEVLSSLSLTPLHLGLPDAIFRRTQVARWSRPNYPTLKYDAMSGRVARADRSLPIEIAGLIGGLIAQYKPALVVGPLGIGRHVDHLIVRDAVRRAGLDDSTGCQFVYASDQPYALTAAQDPLFVRAAGLSPYSWTEGREEAIAALAGYRTQIPILYPDGVIPVAPEVIWVSGSNNHGW
jgi:LmbE family N-acetylglucosaminyl deacetylase